MNNPNELRRDCERALLELQNLVYDVSEAVHRCDENLSLNKSELLHVYALLSAQLGCKKEAFETSKADFDSIGPYDENLWLLQQLRDLICSRPHDMLARISDMLRAGEEGEA